MGKVDAYTLMAAEFMGAPKKFVIQAHMRMALTKYGLQENRANLEEFGITLISLKKNHGISELTILKHACVNFNPDVSFRMQATISAVYLSRLEKKN